MKQWTVVAVALVAACGSLPDQGGSVVALEVVTPDSPTLIVGHSLALHARARNLQGDSIAAAIFWRTPDTALVTLDSVAGVIVARVNTGSARIQARVGTLVSNIIVIALRADTSSSVRSAP